MTSIAILMTCFNRRESTLACLESLFAQNEQYPRSVQVILVDDGSTDGTGDAVKKTFPAVRVLPTEGNLFWNGGMRVAFAEALKGDYDFYLWLNDDTILFPHALDMLLRVAVMLEKEGRKAIVVGSTCNAETGKRSYGGVWQQRRWLRNTLVSVEPKSDQSQACDTMNGNCTLIPREIVRTLGNLDPAFTHSFGDMDYGFRARRAGFSVYITPSYLGSCADNSKAGTWRDASASLGTRWKHLSSRKGSPFREWSIYCRRHLGPLWPLYAVSPYVKVITSSVLHLR